MSAHPDDREAVPEGRYDLVVIGGGAGGLVAAAGAAQLGARAAIVERRSLGGDCLNYGCVPSKGLIRSARLAAEARRMPAFGIDTGEVRVDFARVMRRMREAQARIGEHDSRERFEAMGVEVVFGAGRFVDGATLRVGGRLLQAKRFLLSTGSSPFVPPIPGLADVPYLTNETVFDLEALPRRLIVLGAGPIGLELAQAFQLLGAEVEVLELAPKLLPRLDEEMAALLARALGRAGLRLHFGVEVRRAERRGRGIVLVAQTPGGAREWACDALLVAVGRAPNVEGLGLEKAGVKYSHRGVETDAHLRTSNPRIYAVGDVRGQFQFTHMAEYEAGVALRNMLFSEPLGLSLPFLKKKARYHAVPWCIYTSPEAAHVGTGEEEARGALGEGGCRVYRFPMERVDRAVLEGETEGFCKVVCDARGRVIGADLVGPAAGEVMHEFALAVRRRMHVREIVETIHVYPTLAQVNKRAAGQYYAERLFRPAVRRRMQLLFGLTGSAEVRDPRGGPGPQPGGQAQQRDSSPPAAPGRRGPASAARLSSPKSELVAGQPPRGGAWRFAAVFGALVAAVAVLWLSGAFQGFEAEKVARLARNFGPLAPLAFIALYAGATVFLFPGSVLSLAGGLLFGPLMGMIFNVTGASLGATGAFLVARFGGRQTVEWLLRGRLKTLDERAARRGFLLIFYLRLIPLVPFNALNYAAGLSPIRLGDYAAATVLGILPGAFAYTYLGDAVGELLRGRFSDQVWIALAVFAAAALLPLVLKRVLPKPEAL